MTIQTFAPASGDQHKDPDYYAGRADAYDEHNAGADADTLEDRFEWMTDPTVPTNTNQMLSTAYLQGYKAFIEDLRGDQHWKRYLANLEHAAWLAAIR